MKTKNTLRNMAAIAALFAVAGMAAVSAHAQDSKPSAKKPTQTASKDAGKKYECQHCKEPMSYAAAKAKGFKCCGMKMVEVKPAKKSTNKKG
jgi:hypothetical protein